MTRSNAPDAPDRGERYIALIHSFWRSVKSEVIKVVQDYNRQPPTRRRIITNSRRNGVRSCARGRVYPAGFPARNRHLNGLSTFRGPRASSPGTSSE